MAWALTSDMEGTYGSAEKTLINRAVLEKSAILKLSRIHCRKVEQDANAKFRLVGSE